MADWWEAAPLVDQPMRPMVAHEQKSANWWDSAPLVEEPKPREMTNYRGLRIARQGDSVEVNPTPDDEERAALNKQAEIVNGLGLGVMAGPALAAVPAVATAGRVLGNPLVWGGAAAAKNLYETGNPASAAWEGIKAGTEAELGGRAFGVVARRVAPLLARLGGGAAAKAVERAVASEAAPIAETATAEAAPVARKLAPIPAKGNVKPATVYTNPSPVQGPKPLTEMQIVTRGRQEEAAKAAGLDIAEVFGTKAAPKAEQAAEGALMTRLRASVMMKKDPVGLVNEVAQKATELAQSGLSKEQVGAEIANLYGLTPEKFKQLADAATYAQGLK